MAWFHDYLNHYFTTSLSISFSLILRRYWKEKVQPSKLLHSWVGTVEPNYWTMGIIKHPIHWEKPCTMALHLPFLFLFFFFNVHGCVCLHISLCTICMQAWCPQKPEQGSRFPRTRVIDDCKILNARWELNPGLLGKQILNKWVIFQLHSIPDILGDSHS